MCKLMFKIKFSILFSEGNAYMLMHGCIIVSVTFLCFSRLLFGYLTTNSNFSWKRYFTWIFIFVGFRLQCRSNLDYEHLTNAITFTTEKFSLSCQYYGIAPPVITFELQQASWSGCNVTWIRIFTFLWICWDYWGGRREAWQTLKKLAQVRKSFLGADVCSNCIYRWMPYKGKLAFNRYCT